MPNDYSFIEKLGIFILFQLEKRNFLPTSSKFQNQDLTPDLISCFLKSSMIKLFAKPVAESIRAEVSDRAKSFMINYGRSPKLSVILVGADPGSVIYTQKKEKWPLNLE